MENSALCLHFANSLCKFYFLIRLNKEKGATSVTSSFFLIQSSCICDWNSYNILSENGHLELLCHFCAKITYAGNYKHKTESHSNQGNKDLEAILRCEDSDEYRLGHL